MTAVQALAPTASATPALGAVAAAERMAQLQQLIARVEAGPGAFAAALRAAQMSGGTATPSSPTAASYQGASSAGASMNAALATGPSNAATATTASASDPAAAPYIPMIEQAAARNGVDPALLYGLIEQESGFDPRSRSSAGAQGLTQLMPGTAASLGVSEPLDPAQSIEGGARYLGEMLHRFGGDPEKALAAYNAGPGAVQSYGGVPPYAETQQYVEKVLGYAAAYRQSAPVIA
jgi:soluble lytic murein transglycosylase-like protein